MSKTEVEIANQSPTGISFLIQESSENGVANPDPRVESFSISELLHLPQITQIEAKSHTRDGDREIYYSYLCFNFMSLQIAWRRKYTYEGGFASMFGGPVEITGPFLVTD